MTATKVCLGSRPAANAFGAGSSMSRTSGVSGSPAAIDMFSTIRYSSGCSAFVTTWAPVTPATTRDERNQEKSTQATPPITNASAAGPP